jgi:hypothetical protein
MLTVFGSLAVGTMFVSYWLENRSAKFVALFALGCAASSVYGFLIQSYPFGAIEAAWTLVALWRFRQRQSRDHVAAVR